MFLGHFAVGLAAKKAAPKVSLGTLFMAGQLLDLIWPALVLAGVEKVSVDPGATAFTPLEFHSYPYSHSLVMALAWSALFGFGYYGFARRKRDAVILSAVVFSHWVLDWISHKPDLPLGLEGSTKVGLGLWDSVPATVAVELGLFAAGIYLFLKARPLASLKSRMAFLSLIGFLLLIFAGNAFGPPPPPEATSAMIAGPALAMWVLVAWGRWADRTKR